jgi:plasmid stabilization system protein ParE
MKKLRVFLSPLAERKLFVLLDYLTEEWGIVAKDKFLLKFKNAVNQVSIQPKSCPESNENGIFRCVVTPQSSFYYRIKNDEIEIITLFDNRQDQQKIFEELKKHFNKN